MSNGVALITGASSGIGEALARKFASRNYDLIITARREEKLAALADELGKSIQVYVIPCDLGAPDGAASLINAVSARALTVDILVNNAGIAFTGKFEEMTPAEVSGMVALNIQSLSELTHHYVNQMRERGAGRVLNVASIAGFQPVPSMSLYAATKSFVLSLTEGLSEELRGTGVSVTALCPGLTRTEMVDALDAQDIPAFMMSSAEEVAREGFDALMAREVIRIPGVANQAAVTWAKYQPRWLVRGLGGMFARFNPAGR